MKADSTSGDSLRDRQRYATHEAIREAAFELAVSRGVPAITVADVAKAAGVSQRTFFNHFRTKEEALLPDLPGFRPEEVEAFVTGQGPDLLAALERLLLGHLADLHARRPATASPERLMRLVEANPQLLPGMLATFEAFEHQVADLVARRTGRPTADVFCRVTALAATGAVRVALAEQRCPAPATDGSGGPDGPGGPGRSSTADHGPVDPDTVVAAFAALRSLLADGAEPAPPTPGNAT
jgi:AcrR family transcriptional regulator